MPVLKAMMAESLRSYVITRAFLQLPAIAGIEALETRRIEHSRHIGDGMKGG